MNEIVVVTRLSKKVDRITFGQLNENAKRRLLPRFKTHLCMVVVSDATLTKATEIAQLNGCTLGDVLNSSI
jgi:hypothetical protein